MTKIEEATVSLAAAKEISAVAAVTAKQDRPAIPN